MKILSLSEIFEFYSKFFPNTYDSFKTAYVSALAVHCDLTKPQSTSISAIRKAVTQSSEIAPPAVKFLLDKYCSVSASFNPKKKNNATQITGPPPSEARSILLSANRSKKIKRNLLGLRLPYPSVCTIANCDVCQTICREAPLTACSHQNAHVGDYFPHIKRDVLKNLHVTRKIDDILTSLTGILNPARKTPSESSNSGQTVDIMEVEPPKAPVPIELPPKAVKKTEPIPAVVAKKGKSAKKVKTDEIPVFNYSDEEYRVFFHMLSRFARDRNHAVKLVDDLGFENNITVHEILNRVKPIRE